MADQSWPHIGSSLFLVEQQAGPHLPDGLTVAVLAPSSLTPAQFATHAYAVWVFLRGAPDAADLSAIGGRIKELLLLPQHRNVRMLWVTNPQDALHGWTFSALSWTQEGGSAQLDREQHFDVGNYSFSLAAGCGITVDAGTAALTVHRQPESNHAFELSSGFGASRFHSVGLFVGISLTGEDGGCLRFQFQLSREGDSGSGYGYPAFGKLEAGFRTFFRDPDMPSAGEDFDVASIRMPLLEERLRHPLGLSYAPGHLDFQVKWDVLYPLSGQRFRMAFSESPATGFPSCYRTHLGYYLHLLPEQAGFCLQRLPHHNGPSGEAQYYLAPYGTFALQAPRYHADGRQDLIPDYALVCGLSGIENFKLSQQDSPKLSLVPDLPAFLPRFSSVSSLLRDLPTLMGRFSSRPLPPDTRDLDLRIEDKEEGEAEESLGITDVERMELIEIIRKDYFPPGHRFSDGQMAAFAAYITVEELVDGLETTLQEVTLGNSTSASALSGLATSSWAYVIANGGAVYHAQADQAALFRAEGTSTTFLDFLEIPTLGMPQALTAEEQVKLSISTGNSALAFPMFPYAGASSRHLSDVRQMEVSIIAKERRQRLQEISGAILHQASLRATASSTLEGTTPQGLIARFSPDYRTLEQLQLAKDTTGKRVVLSAVQHGSSLKAAFQSSQLFMVISDPGALSDHFSDEALAALSGVTNRPEIQEWLFELGPDHWERKGTVLIFKFHDKPLLELAGKQELWSFASAFNQDLIATRATVSGLLSDAVELYRSGDLKTRRKYEVLARAATEPNWTGVLALNVDVPLRNLPDSLKALSGGMDADLFYAKYLGVEVTQVGSDGQMLLSQQSSLFGLIDYDNPKVPLADPSGYNFHVPSLTVVFRNSQVADFAAEVMLVADRLFHEPSTLQGGPNGKNILVLKGVAEEHNGRVTYSFGFSGDNLFKLSGKNMQEVEIHKAQFVTDPIPNRSADPLPVTGRFLLWGRLRFAYHQGFDVLSFGATPGAAPADPPEPDYLSFSNLQVVMSFKLHQEANQVTDLGFHFDPTQLAFDMERSGWRRHSLYEKFPMKFKGLRHVRDDASAFGKSGFMPISNPISKADLGATWYALQYELNLGSLGSLAGSAGLVVSLMVGWNPAEDGLYIGLRLPGSTAGKKEITIQSLIKISFKTIQMVVYPLDANEDQATLSPNVERRVGYLLKLKNITLKFFSVSLPPGAQAEITLFGDPRDNVERDDKLLGWYAAYARQVIPPTTSNPL